MVFSCFSALRCRKWTSIGFLMRKYSVSIKPKKSLFGSNNISSNKLKSAHQEEHGKDNANNHQDIQPKGPARTRFAPSPTGFLHMGSLRTALYNYLLAKSTKGTFVLRIEDTDQKRLVAGAVENIYETLKWCNVEIDEGSADNKGEYGPYKQSERSEIYSKYAEELLKKGLAYRCFCSKDRLDKLTESAKKLKPPTTVSYDRNCSHIESLESEKKALMGESFTVRFKSPKKYPPFTDLLHGDINLQPQININDVRYEDPILIKSDGLPTYHFANVIDDHLMKITHVIRGEEWLPSTPKHIALYRAFGWQEPKFIHLPLLTSTSEKKLSKRSGDSNVLSLRDKGILPEALVNFCVLFGWSPKRDTPGETSKEVYTMDDLIKLFSLNDLTKGNAKVSDSKLYYFNKTHLHRKLQDPAFFKKAAQNIYNETLHEKYPLLSFEKLSTILSVVGQNLTTLKELESQYFYLFGPADFTTPSATDFINANKDNGTVPQILDAATQCLGKGTENLVNEVLGLMEKHDSGVGKKEVFQTLRFALAGSVPGLKLNTLVEILGQEEAVKRLEEAKSFFC